MKLTTYGAASGEVTGSCHLLEVNGHKVLLDCGLIQGSRKQEALNSQPFPFDPKTIDAVILSHSHIDHCGRLPLLVKRGFKGSIYTQTACKALCKIMLKDSGFLNEKDVEWDNRKRERKGLPLLEALYTVEDARLAMRYFKGVSYDAKTSPLPGITFSLRDAGHILGSSIIELWLEEGGLKRKVVFSGDLGHSGAPILREPTVIEEADFVIMESTYGDRLHRSRQDTHDEMTEVIEAATKAKGNILIPSFAVGRAQELLMIFGKYFDEWNLGRWQLFLDSPMAIEATEVYLKNTELFDDEARDLWKQNRQMPLLPNLHMSRTANQSMGLNRIRSGALIIAGSGMCTGGRIKHHLKHNAWRSDCHIVIVGYQAYGTPGRALVDGAKHIRLWGETVRVAAKVHTIGGFSAHADQKELVDWYGQFNSRPSLLLVHGEDTAREVLAEKIREQFDARVNLAQTGATIDLAAPQ